MELDVISLDEMHEIPDESIPVIDQVISKIMLVWLKEMLHKIPERNRNIFIMHELEGFTFRQIGSCFGISATRVSEINKKVFNRLRYFARIYLNKPQIKI